jgi:type I restriction enzyme S subunit
MSNGWEIKKLREVCELVNGRAYSKPELLAAGKYRVLRVGNFFTNDHWYYSDMELEEKKYCDNGDLLYAWSASFGPRIWTGGKVIYHYHIWKVVHDCTQIDQMFLFYFFQWDMEKIKADQGTGTTMMHVSMGSMNERDIHLPPLPEQQRIVALLDEAFAGLATAKANAERNLQNARALFESHLQSVFSQRGEGWVEKRIEEWCDSVMDCVNKTAPVVEEPTPFKMIRTTNVRNGRVDVSVVRFVTEEIYKIWTRRQIPHKGDVILTREAPMGEVGMLLTNDKVFLGQRLVSYRVNSAKLDNQFLLFALQSGDLQSQIHAKASGSTVQHMRVPDTKNLLLAAPPLTTQRQVVEHLISLREETQRLTRLYERKLAALEELKKSLLHQAFNGEL